MKRRTLTLLVTLLILPSLLYAKWGAVYEGWSGHPRIAGGLVPTTLSAGLRYQTSWGTSISGVGTLGYTERMLYQDPATGSLLTQDLPLYDLVQVGTTVALTQSISVHHFSLGVAGVVERGLDSMIAGTTLPSGVVQPHATWSTNSIYGKLSRVQGNAFFHYRFGEVKGLPVAGEGVQGDIHLSYSFASHAIAAQAALVGMTTFYREPQVGKNLFAITFADRLTASYIHGSKLTPFEQEGTTLGEKIRGFGAFQYPLAFSIANQAEMRFNGPQLLGSAIFPRLIVFVDVGFGAGTLANTAITKNQLLASAGGSLFFTIGPVMDFGYQMAYLLYGENPAHPGAKMVGTLVAHLTC